MSPFKRYVVIAILGLAGLWPLAHRALVPVLEFNPWRLGGWAMYATPSPPVLALLFSPRDGALTPMLDLAAPVAQALDAFRSRRHALGKHVIPNEVAQVAFSHEASLEGVVVVVQTIKLDHETALTTSSKAYYWYDRALFQQTGQPALADDLSPSHQTRP